MAVPIMIDLNAMHRPAIFLMLFVWLFNFGGSGLQQESDPALSIQSPKDGQALQGSIQIIATIPEKDLASYEVFFGYQEDLTGTRFLLVRGDQGVVEQVVTIWDTTMITDGEYRLGIRVANNRGEVQEYIVENLRVRNYTAVETPTPLPGKPQPTTAQTSTPIPTQTQIPPTATPFSPNPGVVTFRDLGQSTLRGVGLVALVFLLGLIYRSVRVRSR